MMINMMMTTFTHEQYSISYVANSSSVFPNVDQSKFSIFCRGPKHLIMLRVVVGENINFSSFAEGVMASQGVQVHLLQVLANMIICTTQLILIRSVK